MDDFDFDVCIIGAGPAGFAAANRCWDFGKSVCIVEKGCLGGAGIHSGALSSKTFWELSKDYQNAIRKDRGYIAENVRLDFSQVVACVNRAADEKVSQISRQLQELSSPRPDYPGSIQLRNGTAKFLSKNSIHVEGTKPGQSGEIRAKNFIIATGSKPRTLDSIPVDGHRIITSDHVSRLKDFPKSLVILGAGVVGCEYATIFSNYGQTKVHLIDRAPRILPFEDADISRICSGNLEKKGVSIHHQAKLLSMKVINDRVEYIIEHSSGGRETIRTDHALISIGRVPNTSSLNLEKAGVEVDERGYVITENTQSSTPTIYAIGDVTYDVALVNVAEIEGRYAAERICGEALDDLTYDNLSSIMFLDPEVAAIGMNELQAQEKKISYKVATYDYSLVNRAVAMRATEGFVKLLVRDDESNEMLGMRALGVHASTMIEAASLIIQQRRPACDLGELLHPHPAITEGLQECVRMLSNSSIYKPHVFKSELRLSRISFDKHDTELDKPKATRSHRKNSKK
jgi:dihydrolipoamide dehydrogenase